MKVFIWSDCSNDYGYSLGIMSIADNIAEAKVNAREHILNMMQNPSEKFIQNLKSDLEQMPTSIHQLPYVGFVEVE
jgi:hypothetical protein